MFPIKDTTLICGANWLGDSVMSMPAVSLLKARAPTARVIMLVKTGMADLWKMCPDVDEVIEFQEGINGAARVVADIREREPARAYVFPNSFRSALIPFMAAVPERIGMPGHQRAWMLTRIVNAPAAPQWAHQSWEYVNLMFDIGRCEGIKPPRIEVPSDLRNQVIKRFSLGDSSELAAIMPGAARGPSKRWPAGHFIEAGRRIAAVGNRRILVLGSGAESDLCAQVASGIGEGAKSLAGQTSLSELAGVFSMCRVVICNDSGGMHLAAACGARVVAIFGLTDPVKTGPMGTGHRVICAERVRQSRDIERDSAAAEKALRSITWETVAQAAEELLR